MDKKNNEEIIGHISKFFYIRFFKIWFIYLFVTTMASYWIVNPAKEASLIDTILIIVLLLVFNIFFWVLMNKSKKSRYVFIDENSVGIHSGFLPWTKGYNSIKWKDLEEALFVQNIVSYAFNSYNIILVHNKLIDKKLIIKDVYNGKQITSKINQILSEKNDKF